MDTNVDIELTEEQQFAVDSIKKWLEDPLGRVEFKLGGYAGTGKTTVVKFLLKILRPTHSIVVCAFTGKAVNVLGKKQVYAQTMHSLMYNVESQLDGTIKFFRKPILEACPDLIIVDEASMISTDLYRDLLSFNRRYLFVGDPGQLEPIGDNPNLMATPDLVLSKIHRQAELSPIITFANNVRQGEKFGLTKVDGLWIKAKEITSPEFLSNDQVICAKNATRKLFNDKIRIYKKLPPTEITVGEKLICLRNNLNYNVYNGMILFVDKIVAITFNAWICNCHDEVDRKLFNLPIWMDPFVSPLQDKQPKIPKNTVWCDFGYAITCHKSQGSEWDNVLVWNEWVHPKVWDMKRWQYTAITRASKNLTFCL